jgi:hypothetical protein
MFFGLLVSFAILWTIYFFLYFFEYGYGGNSYFFMYSYLVRTRHRIPHMFPSRGRVPSRRNANRVYRLCVHADVEGGGVVPAGVRGVAGKGLPSRRSQVDQGGQGALNAVSTAFPVLLLPCSGIRCGNKMDGVVVR